MLDAVKDQVLSAITNARGWRTSRRIVVFESDDWGAAKARDREALDLMSRAGVNLDVTPYERLDCLESRDDLQALFDTLSKHRDARERPPIFTFNTILANPDYQAIGEADFEHYVYEDLPQSYERYFGEDLLPMWRAAMDDRLIQAQFHGREHLNVGLWLNDLKSGHKETNAAFEHGFYGQTTSTSSRIQTNYLAAFWPESTSHFAEILQILVDGLSLFRRVFGFESRTFIACNYVLPRELEGVAAEHGVKLIQGQRGMLCPAVDGSEFKIRRSTTGQRNRHEQMFSVRNVKFEPFEDARHDWVGQAIGQIREAFLFNTPAVVSTHRVNYVGGLDVANRDRNLALLDKLLVEIQKRWPDVEYMSSDELLALISAEDDG